MTPLEFSESSTKIAIGFPGILKITLIFTLLLKVALSEFEALSRRCRSEVRNSYLDIAAIGDKFYAEILERKLSKPAIVCRLRAKLSNFMLRGQQHAHHAKVVSKMTNMQKCHFFSFAKLTYIEISANF